MNFHPDPKMSKITYLILIIIFFLKTNLFAEEITGYAKVIDGDTIKIKGNKIRLYGIDAPENNQICSKPWLSLNIITFSKDYECGDVEFIGSKVDTKAFRQKGMCIIYPSFLPHRVTKVTKGTRNAIVGWIHGPTFK